MRVANLTRGDGEFHRKISTRRGDVLALVVRVDNPSPTMPVYNVELRVRRTRGASGEFEVLRAIERYSSGANTAATSDPVTINLAGKRPLIFQYVRQSARFYGATSQGRMSKPLSDLNAALINSIVEPP